jgi:DNA adenine methylase
MSQAIQQVDFIVSDFSEAISNVEEGDFVYLDPPYVPISKTSSFVDYASGGFNDTEHSKLFNILHNLNSRNIKFLMSNSDAQKVKDEFTDYDKIEVICRRAINSKKPDSKVHEVLIWN